MKRARRPVGGVQASESFARRVEAAAELPPAGPVATAAKAAAESVERYYAAVRAPWVAEYDSTKVRKVRDERRADVCGCWPRYVGGCYCGAGGDRA